MKRKIFIILTGLFLLVIALQAFNNKDIIKNSNLVSKFFDNDEDEKEKIEKEKNNESKKIDIKYKDLEKITGINEFYKVGDTYKGYGFEIKINNFKMTKETEGFSVYKSENYKFDKDNNLIDEKVFLIIDLTVTKKSPYYGDENLVFCPGNIEFYSTDEKYIANSKEETNGSDRVGTYGDEIFLEDIKVGETINRRITYILDEVAQNSPNKYLVINQGGGRDISGETPVALVELNDTK